MTTEEVTLEIADTRPNDVELETFEKEVVTKTKKKATTRKKKPEIIADIQRLRPGQYSESMLRKMRKAELEDMLVRLLEDSISVCSEIPPIQEPGVEAPPRNDIVAKTMYNGVILFSNLCEMLSWQTKRYTGGYVLDNFSQQLEQNKEDLQEICVELAEEYQEVVAAYCSVESRLALIFISAGLRSAKHFSHTNKYACQIQSPSLHSFTAGIGKDVPSEVPAPSSGKPVRSPVHLRKPSRPDPVPRTLP